MSLTQLDGRFRLTLPKEVRRSLRITKGQRVYIAAGGDTMVIKVLSRDPSEDLARILGDFKFDRAARRQAEKWLLKEVSRDTS